MNMLPSIALLSGSPGPGEIIVIFFFILVLFGPRKLPEIAKMIGKTLHELRRASEDFKDQIMAIETEVIDDEDVVSEDSDDVYADSIVDGSDSGELDDGAPEDEYPEYDDFDSGVHETAVDSADAMEQSVLSDGDTSSDAAVTENAAAEDGADGDPYGLAGYKEDSKTDGEGTA